MFFSRSVLTWTTSEKRLGLGQWVVHSKFHTGFFPGRGKCRCVQWAHAHIDPLTRVMQVFMKCWTYLRYKKVRFSCNILNLYFVILLYIFIVAVEVTMTSNFWGEGFPAPPPHPLHKTLYIWYAQGLHPFIAVNQALSLVTHV